MTRYVTLNCLTMTIHRGVSQLDMRKAFVAHHHMPIPYPWLACHGCRPQGLKTLTATGQVESCKNEPVTQ